MDKLLDKYLHIFRNPIFFASYILLMSLCFVWLDRPLAHFFHSLDLSNKQFFLHSLTSMGLGKFYVIAFLLGFLFFKFIYKKDELARTFLFLWLAIIIPGIICDIFKVILARARPMVLFHHHVYGFQFFKFNYLFWSFPSGHTTVVTSLMLALSLLKPKLWPFFMTIALAVISTRLILSAHFLSDVMGGFYLATFCMGYLHEYFMQDKLILSRIRLKRKHAKQT